MVSMDATSAEKDYIDYTTPLFSIFPFFALGVSKMEEIRDVKVLGAGEFSRKFKDFSKIFESGETLIERDDIGLWILAIFPANRWIEENNVREGTLFYEEAAPTSDPRRFACVSEGRLILGECDYYIDGEELANYLEDTLEDYERVEEEVREFTEKQRWWCISCSSYMLAEPVFSIKVRESGEKVITIKLYCSYCGQYLDTVYQYE